jgi:DNA-binding LacI/PurR family transcriptional regulator
VERRKRVTLADVAQAAGVSPATVSMSLSNNSLVADATRRRILEIAQRLGYTRHPMARRLATHRSDSLCVAFATGPENVFYWDVIHGIMEAAERKGYRLSFSTPARSGDAGEVEPPAGRADLPAIDPDDVDGILVLNWRDRYVVRHLLDFGLPLVMIDASGEYPDIASVDNDDRGGARMGVEYLIRLGHRSIGFVGTPLDEPFGREVWQGYLEAMAAADLSIDPHLVVAVNLTMEEAAVAADRLLGLARPPTAIFSVNDEMAVGVLRAAQRRGIAVPGDLAVVGMDDIHLAALVDPPLTTVRIDRHALGVRATSMLIELIRETYSGPRKVTLSPHLVVRASCGGALEHRPMGPR